MVLPCSSSATSANPQRLSASPIGLSLGAARSRSREVGLDVEGAERGLVAGRLHSLHVELVGDEACGGARCGQHRGIAAHHRERRLRGCRTLSFLSSRSLRPNRPSIARGPCALRAQCRYGRRSPRDSRRSGRFREPSRRSVAPDAGKRNRSTKCWSRSRR